jgi:methylmalonyl-CoA/ethylmalonyl-CoA epimerase
MVITEALRLLKLPSVGQIGMVVYDVDKTLDYYAKTFGIKPWSVNTYQPVFTLEKSGPVHATLKIAMAYSGGVQIELIEVTQGRSYYNDTLDQREGLHHLGFMVNDLEERVEACRAQGIGVIQRGQIKHKGFTVDYAYMDTVAIGGVIFEFIQTRLGPIPIKMNRFTHHLSCWLGI